MHTESSREGKGSCFANFMSIAIHCSDSDACAFDEWPARHLRVICDRERNMQLHLATTPEKQQIETAGTYHARTAAFPFALHCTRLSDAGSQPDRSSTIDEGLLKEY